MAAQNCEILKICFSKSFIIIQSYFVSSNDVKAQNRSKLRFAKSAQNQKICLETQLFQGGI